VIEHENGELEYIYSEGCPWKQVDAEVTWFVELFVHYDSGHLLVAGSMMEQPNWYLDAMRYLKFKREEAKSNANKEAQEEARMKSGLPGLPR